MNTINLANLVINQKTVSEDHIGEGNWNFPPVMIQRVTKALQKQGFIVKSDEIGFFEVAEDLHSDTQFLEEFLNDLEYQQGGHFHCSNIDVCLCIVDFYHTYCIDDDIAAPHTIAVEYSHLMWLLHDVSHILHDTCDFTIAIEQGAEEMAIRYSIEALAEINYPLPLSEIAKIDQEFAARFRVENYNFFYDYAIECQESNQVNDVTMTIEG